MRYVANAFSMKMIQNPSTLTVSFLSKERFLKEANYNCKSVIGHEKVAEYLGLPCNRETIHLVAGDTIFIATESDERNNSPFEFTINSESEKFYRVDVL